MLHFKLEIARAGCEGRLINEVADIKITNTGEFTCTGTKYDVDAFYCDRGGRAQHHKFNVTHVEAAGMFALVQVVVSQIEQIENDKIASAIADAIAHRESEFPKKKNKKKR